MTEQSGPTTKYAMLLNALCVMQESPAYAVRKGILEQAENTIVRLERDLSAMTAERDALDCSAREGPGTYHCRHDSRCLACRERALREALTGLMLVADEIRRTHWMHWPSITNHAISEMLNNARAAVAALEPKP